ncbi:hypothetical protein FBU30_004402 [Linnemannia zychae]|nr:hypothetical protein FBU30_004402 [Linnemannia zychae]
MAKGGPVDAEKSHGKRNLELIGYENLEAMWEIWHGTETCNCTFHDGPEKEAKLELIDGENEETHKTTSTIAIATTTSTTNPITTEDQPSTPFDQESEIRNHQLKPNNKKRKLGTVQPPIQPYSRPNKPGRIDPYYASIGFETHMIGFRTFMSVRYILHPSSAIRTPSVYKVKSSPFQYLTALQKQYEQMRSTPSFDTSLLMTHGYGRYILFRTQFDSDSFDRFTSALQNRREIYPHIEKWTWRRYESLFVDTVVDWDVKSRDVFQYIQQGRRPNELYKVYAYRLQRLADVYNLDILPFWHRRKNDIFQALKSTLDINILFQMSL